MIIVLALQNFTAWMEETRVPLVFVFFSRGAVGFQLLSEEDVVSTVFERHGLRMAVHMSKGKVGDDATFPYITVTSWIQSLDRQGKLDRFLGMGPDIRTLKGAGKSLESFWDRYKLMHGGHEVFHLTRSQGLNLKCCVPIYLHGDEGTTYKKDGCLCVSFHSPFGRGTISNKLGPMPNDAIVDLHQNFVGHAFETRFLLGALLRAVRFRFVCCELFGWEPKIISLVLVRKSIGYGTVYFSASTKEDYRDDSTVRSDLLELIVRSVDHASRNGVLLMTGEKLYPIPIGQKGDWPYIVTCPVFCRFSILTLSPSTFFKLKFHI